MKKKYDMGSDLPSIVGEPALKYQNSLSGISKSDFLGIVAETGMNLTEFSSLLPVSKRTIEKVKDKELLSPQVSDRVLQIASLYQFGNTLFGSPHLFNEWLHTSLLALGGKKPFDFMHNDTGISYVKDMIGRIEHGVYS